MLPPIIVHWKRDKVIRVNFLTIYPFHNNVACTCTSHVIT
jgi:hypothetical protein